MSAPLSSRPVMKYLMQHPNPNSVTVVSRMSSAHLNSRGFSPLQDPLQDMSYAPPTIRSLNGSLLYSASVPETMKEITAPLFAACLPQKKRSSLKNISGRIWSATYSLWICAPSARDLTNITKGRSSSGSITSAPDRPPLKRCLEIGI
jgi:hypothetical protein